MCNDCPFSKNSIRGFLATYTIEQIRYYLNNSVYFICHKHVKQDTDNDECMRAVKAGELPLCRGFMECMAKSCIAPRDPDLNRIRNAVKKDLSNNSMDWMRFVQHHDLLYTPKPLNNI